MQARVKSVVPDYIEEQVKHRGAFGVLLVPMAASTAVMQVPIFWPKRT